MLDDLGLVDAVEWHVNEFERRTGVRCQVDRVGTVAGLSPSVTIAIFRIFQEALTNILRHADASVVEVGVIAGADAFDLTVRDDGVGMTPADGARPGLGIVGMHERAALIGATLEIASQPDRGTVVHLRAPLGADGPVTP
jgi:signal transduction histidine kinase